ncbi:prolyl oligopeptidase family serine peptidase [Saccharopolyspora taberi]|uniref:Prolyl oligopeptidase family serine peptidase n=2 Tax=Saccharopolyspora taberi TaxID=60895 RepID=A0ABN3VAT9_9PSEU
MAAPAQADPPGTVIDAGPLPGDQWLPGAGAAHRVTYTSTGPGDASATVTGTIFVPAGPPPAGGWPVVSWAHGTTGLGDGCAPSVRPRLQPETEHLAAWLKEGYAIVATDYAGLGTPGVHPYLDGRTAAHGVVDIVRAARAVVPELSPSWVAVGHSQGGHSGLFTANLATRYAPELDFRGAVATGPPSNLTRIIGEFDPSTPPLPIMPGLTALTSYILAGVQAATPGFDVQPYLSPLGREVVADAERLCMGEQMVRTEGISIGQLLSKPLDERFRQAMGAAFDVPTTGYDRPVFIGQGDSDKVVPAFLTKRLVDDLEAAGQPYTYRTYPADHMDTVPASLPDSLDFVRRLFGR